MPLTNVFAKASKRQVDLIDRDTQTGLLGFLLSQIRPKWIVAHGKVASAAVDQLPFDGTVLSGKHFRFRSHDELRRIGDMVLRGRRTLVGFATILMCIVLSELREQSVKPTPAMVPCDVCGKAFQFGPHRYDGRAIATYGIAACMQCWDSNWDGWARHFEAKVKARLLAEGRASPPRNLKGLLPRE